MGCAIYRMVKGSSYQNWATYDDSPLSISDYPYEAIIYLGGTRYLFLYDHPIEVTLDEPSGWYALGRIFTGMTAESYSWMGGGYWGNPTTLSLNSFILFSTAYSDFEINIQQCNHDICYGETVLKAKTIDAVSEMSKIRIRNVRHKDTSFVRDRAMYYKDSTWKRVNI